MTSTSTPAGRRRQDDASRVLVIEDDDAIRHAVVTALDRAGYTVTGAHDGSSGLAAVEAFRPDLVVVDVGLGPGPDGLTVARRVTEDRSLPVIILTAADTLDDRLAGFDTGADDYLTKPFALEELLVRVRAVLRRSGREVSPVWQVADLVVDEAARTAQRNGTEVALTPTEFDVLVALGRQRGTVVGKHKLLAAVWGFHAHDLNLVDTYVSTLRRKLEAHGPRLVHTVRGVGLVLRP